MGLGKNERSCNLANSFSRPGKNPMLHKLGSTYFYEREENKNLTQFVIIFITGVVHVHTQMLRYVFRITKL